MRRALLILAVTIVLGGCRSPGGPYPTLAPRPAEAIDPRVPVVAPINNRPVAPALGARLAQLEGQARGGEAGFATAAVQAELLAAAAGAAQSDGWAAAQTALSVAVSARAPVAKALADIDALSADALQANGGIAPNDLAAIERAAGEVGAIDLRQADRISALQRRLSP